MKVKAAPVSTMLWSRKGRRVQAMVGVIYLGEAVPAKLGPGNAVISEGWLSLR